MAIREREISKFYNETWIPPLDAKGKSILKGKAAKIKKENYSKIREKRRVKRSKSVSFY